MLPSSIIMAAMPLSPRRLVPMAHVADVPRAIAFYAKLGFTVDNTFKPRGATDPAWAYLASGEAQLMIAKASEPVVPSQQAVLFYVYVDDVDAAHREMAAQAITASAITFPFYAPKGEFRVVDPDGYVVMIMHT